MREVSHEIYTANELSHGALENAHNEFLASGLVHDLYFEEEISSLKSVFDLFWQRLDRYSLDSITGASLKYNVDQDNLRDIKLTDVPDQTHGLFVDVIALQHFKERMADNCGDIKSAFIDAVGFAAQTIVDEMEGRESLEYFKEVSDINEWEYYSNGDLFVG